MVTTKKMMKDIKKISNLLVCDICGSEDIQEKMWIDINNQITIQGVWYAHVIDATDGDSCWCCKCEDTCKPITFEEYMEGKK